MSQIRKLILVEAGLIGLLANVAGLALGIVLSLLLIFVINKQSFGWTIQFHWPVAVLLGGADPGLRGDGARRLLSRAHRDAAESDRGRA